MPTAGLVALQKSHSMADPRPLLERRAACFVPIRTQTPARHPLRKAAWHSVRRHLVTLVTLFTFAVVAAHSPLAWAGPSPAGNSERARAASVVKQAPNRPGQRSVEAQAPNATQAKASPVGEERRLGEERRQKLAEREKQNGKLEEYEGGVVLIIGAGVLAVALAVVLIVVLVD